MHGCWSLASGLVCVQRNFQVLGISQGKRASQRNTCKRRGGESPAQQPLPQKASQKHGGGRLLLKSFCPLVLHDTGENVCRQHSNQPQKVATAGATPSHLLMFCQGGQRHWCGGRRHRADARVRVCHLQAVAGAPAQGPPCVFDYLLATFLPCRAQGS